MTTHMNTDLKQSWQRIAQRLKGELGDDLFTSWFARVEPEELVHDRTSGDISVGCLRCEGKNAAELFLRD